MFFKKKQKGTLDMSRIPKHIGIIMDGNGRWAKRQGLPRTAGHKQGAKTLETIIRYCGEIGVEVVTAYAFSTENWCRPQDEVDALMELLYDYLSQAEKRFKENDVRLIISGDTSKFSEKLREAMQSAMEITKDGKAITLNLALNYGCRDEIIRAVKNLYSDIENANISKEDICEDVFSKYLDTKNLPEVDMIIRPSGEYRLSNFLLWQAAYAEFWYSNICWPDFKNEDLESAIIDFQNRNRRFGGV